MLEIAGFIQGLRSTLGRVTRILRGNRLVAAGLITVCIAIGASVATVSVASASTAGHTSTTADAATAAHASSTVAADGPAGRGLSVVQVAMLAARAKLSQDGAITGSIAGFDGQPVTGACVTAVGAGRSVTATAAPGGTFMLAGLPAGSYALEYQDCAAAGRYLPTWSGGAVAQSSAATNTAAHVQVTAGRVRRVPVVTLKPVSVAAAMAAEQASFRHALAANNRRLPAAAAAKTGEVSGTVTGNGKPLDGICIRVEREGRLYGARTGKNGKYTARNIVPGKYYVVFAQSSICPSRANWLQQVYKGDNNPFATSDNGGSVITVRARHTTAGISGNLELGGEIAGTVTSKSGAKLHGICVVGDGIFPHNEGVRYSGQTGANGSFQLHALPPGKYALQFTLGCGSGGENYAPASHPKVKLALRQHLTVNEVMPAGASISGTVTLSSSSGSPLNGICVDAFDPRGDSNGFTSTNSSGEYRVVGLIGGSYQLDFYPGCNNNGNYTSVTLTAHTTAGQQTSNINAVLQVGASIAGTITNSHGKAVPGICAEIISNDFGGFGSFENNNGSYSFDRLPAGTYQVGFFGGCGNSGSYAPYWYSGQSSENTATPITLATGQAFTADAVLQPGATITGKVNNAAGNALSGVCVNASTRSDGEFGLFFGSQTGTKRGTYTLSNLAPGQYTISFGCGFTRNYASQYFPGAPDQGAAELVSAGAGRTSGINAVLRPGGSISGVVTDKAGHPLTDVCVSAVNTRGAVPALRGISEFDYVFGFGVAGAEGTVITGSHGTFQISGLAAGRYQVAFSQCFGPRGYIEQWYRGKASQLAATDVTVRAGRTTSGIDGRLSRGGTISGRVVNGSGKPLTNICILATNQSTSAAVGAVPGKGGTYTLPGLASGRYTVQFTPCGTQNLVTVVTTARVTSPHVTKGVNATMRPGGSIAGVVTAGSSGPALSNACVEAYSKNSAEPAGFGFTGIDGSYSVTGLAAGSYQVYFGDPQCELASPGLAPQWFGNQATQAASTPVSVTVGATTGSVEAALQPDGAITGTVSAGSPATSLSGACVTAFPVAASGSLPVVAVSGPSGYMLGDLLPGQYKVRFAAGCGATGYATQWYNGAASRTKATVITVTAAGIMTGISATLSKTH